MIEEPYYFLKFGNDISVLYICIEQFIKKKKIEYRDVSTETNLKRLKNDLYNLQNLMSENIDLILDRDKSLN